MTRGRFSGPLCLLSLILTFAACTPARTPVVTATLAAPTLPPATTAVPRPSATPEPLPSAVPTPLPSLIPTTPAPGQLPAGWERMTNDQLSIALPPGWRAVDLGGEDAQAAFERLKQNDARLAGMIGSPVALQDAAFWAFAAEPLPGSEEEGFVDNLNIRRTPLGAQRLTGMQQVIEMLLPQYEKMGLVVTSTDATLRIDDHPAARITYTLMMDAASGKASEVRGRQVIVATDSDLWVLTLATTPEREGHMAAEFQTIADSFQPQ